MKYKRATRSLQSSKIYPKERNQTLYREAHANSSDYRPEYRGQKLRLRPICRHQNRESCNTQGYHIDNAFPIHQTRLFLIIPKLAMWSLRHWQRLDTSSWTRNPAEQIDECLRFRHGNDIVCDDSRDIFVLCLYALLVV